MAPSSNSNESQCGVREPGASAAPAPLRVKLIVRDDRVDWLAFRGTSPVEATMPNDDMTMVNATTMHNHAATRSHAARAIDAPRTDHCIGVGHGQDHAANEEANRQSQPHKMLHGNSPVRLRTQEMMRSTIAKLRLPMNSGKANPQKTGARRAIFGHNADLKS
jgi:hypothetical protein